MRYLQLPRARRALLLFFLSSLVLASFPEIDLRASGLFYRDGVFPLESSKWTRLLQESVGTSILAALVAVLGLYVVNRFRQSDVCGVDAKVVGYLFAVLILGAGLTVNVVFKGNFGRARPRNVVEFGGPQQFTPAFVVADECAANCSFSSGDGAGACFVMAMALALSRRRAILVAAVSFALLVSVSRIAAGAHFLSDTVVSFFVMWITADALRFYILLPRQAAQDPIRAPRPARLSVGRGTHGAG